jgi:hypothetical protein
MKCSASSLGGPPRRLPIYCRGASLSMLLPRRLLGHYRHLTSLQVPHCHLAAGMLALKKSCSPHCREHCVPTSLGFAIKKDFEFSSEAVLTHFIPILFRFLPSLVSSRASSGTKRQGSLTVVPWSGSSTVSAGSRRAHFALAIPQSVRSIARLACHPLVWSGSVSPQALK